MGWRVHAITSSHRGRGLIGFTGSARGRAPARYKVGRPDLRVALMVERVALPMERTRPGRRVTVVQVALLHSVQLQHRRPVAPPPSNGAETTPRAGGRRPLELTAGSHSWPHFAREQRLAFLHGVGGQRGRSPQEIVAV
jgi:hypothetical protein